MRPPLTAEFLETVLDRLATSNWSRRHLPLIVSIKGNGVVTGAEEHFDALRRLATLDMGDAAPPSRFCMPGEFDE